MKKHFSINLNQAVRKTIVRLALTSFLFVNFIPGIAQAQDTTNPLATEVVIKYVGALDEKPVFQIEFDNKEGENFILSLKDEDGNIIFHERFKDKRFSKKFQLDRSDLDNVKLIMTVYSLKDKQSQVFEINKNIRVVQDVFVTKL